ncbi:MAG: efflux RND transporter periplasmic adaptor subunit [bacterium]
MKKGLIVISVIILVIFVLIVFQLNIRNSQKFEIEGVLPAVEIASVRVMDYVEHYMGFGTVLAEDQVPVFPKAPGKLIRFTSSEGQYVYEGQTIALVDRDIPGVEFKSLKVDAPTSGIISQTMVDPGATVSPTQPIAMIISSRRVKMLLSISEKDIGKLRVGQNAIVSLDAFPGENINGKIKKISPTANPLSHTFDVEVSIENKEGKVKNGMFGKAFITTSEPRKMLFIPVDALVKRSIEGVEKYSVFVVEDGFAKERNIETGIVDFDRIQIISGLSEGEHIVVRGLTTIKSGMKVNVVSEMKWGDDR